jgi:hypothetical protein
MKQLILSCLMLLGSTALFAQQSSGLRKETRNIERKTPMVNRSINDSLAPSLSTHSSLRTRENRKVIDSATVQKRKANLKVTNNKQAN